MSSSSSDNNNIDLLQEIVKLHKDHSKVKSEKEAALQSLIASSAPSSSSGSGDLLPFLLLFRSSDLPDNSLFIPALSILEKYSSLFLDIIVSPLLMEWLNWSISIQSRDDSLHLAIISMLKISYSCNIHHRPIPSDHLYLVIDYALRCMTSVGSLELSEAASRLIQVIIAKDATPAYFSLLSQCVEQHKSNPILIYRYLSLIASLCVNNEETTKRCIELNIPSLVFSIIRSATSDPSKMDILSAINGIEIMKQFSTTEAGLEELLKDHILDWLVRSMLLRPFSYLFFHSCLLISFYSLFLSFTGSLRLDVEILQHIHQLILFLEGKH
jgi:hypothetical protein